MADVLVKNMRTQDLELNTANASAKIPAGVLTPAGFAPGYTKVDASFIGEARKNVVVAWYFTEGWLIAEDLSAAEDIEEEIEQIHLEAHEEMAADIKAAEELKAAENAPADSTIAPPVDGALAGVVEQSGEVKPLAEMTKAELLELATAEEIEGRHNMTKAELIAALEAPKE